MSRARPKSAYRVGWVPAHGGTKTKANVHPGSARASLDGDEVVGDNRASEHLPRATLRRVRGHTKRALPALVKAALWHDIGARRCGECDGEVARRVAGGVRGVEVGLWSHNAQCHKNTSTARSAVHLPPPMYWPPRKEQRKRQRQRQQQQASKQDTNKARTKTPT